MSIILPSGERCPRILVVEDSASGRLMVRASLADDRFEFVEATDGRSALKAVLGELPDLVLLDLGLPDCDGFEILRRLQEDRRVRDVPVIVVSASSRIEDKVRGLDMGAVDFVTKPYESVELRARVHVALRIKLRQEALARRAHVDGLTGLANRLALEERLATEWGLHRRHGGPLAVWVADLDHFKRINDSHGHAAGDEVLRRASAMLRATVRATDMAARFGGEEFVVVAPHCGLAGALKTAERFRDRLAAATIAIDDDAPIRVTVSIGVASAPEAPAITHADLLNRADSALYQAKSQGRNQVFGPSPLPDPAPLLRNGSSLART